MSMSVLILSWVCLVKDIIPEKEVNALLFSHFENFQGLIDVISNKVDTTITLKEDTDMNSILKSSEVFALKDLVPYQEGKIVNMDLVNDPGLKFVVMSFTKGCALPEHAAPGEALIFALDGEGTIGYEGNEYHIKAGENFKFDKGGAHYVKADGNFKMALLLTLA